MGLECCNAVEEKLNMYNFVCRTMDKWDINQFAFKALAQSEIRGQWIRWKRNFEYVVAASGEKNQTKLKYLLLARAGPDVQEVFQSIPGADVEQSDDVNPYEVALKKLDEYFAPKHHDSMERNIFWTLKPETGENLEKFMLRAREQAYKCSFGKSEQDSRDICVIDKITLMAHSLSSASLSRLCFAQRSRTKLRHSCFFFPVCGFFLVAYQKPSGSSS